MSAACSRCGRPAEPAWAPHLAFPPHPRYAHTGIALPRCFCGECRALATLGDLMTPEVWEAIVLGTARLGMPCPQLAGLRVLWFPLRPMAGRES